MDEPAPLTAQPPGAARCPGPSTADIIRADKDNATERLLAGAPAFLGDAPIDYSRYADPAFFSAEIVRMWRRTWQWACRVEQISEVVDYVVYDIGRWSVIVVRSGSDEIRAFHPHSRRSRRIIHECSRHGRNAWACLRSRHQQPAFAMARHSRITALRSDPR
jgi:hypothetical protein